MDRTARAAAIEASLALVASTVGDPAPLVYARLFERHPAMEAEFWRDRSGSIRGEMLARAFEAVLDLVGANGYAAHMIGGEATTHDNYGIPRDVFADFFPILAATLSEAGGDGWTPAMQAAWYSVLAEVAGLIAALPGPDAPERMLDPDTILPPGPRGLPFPMR